MKKWNRFASIFQIIVGTAAIITYAVIAASGEAIGKWTITLLLAIAYVIIGIIGLVDCKKENKE